MTLNYLKLSFCCILTLICYQSSAQKLSNKNGARGGISISGMQEFPGFFNFYWDAEKGKIWLEVNELDREFLYVHSLAAGVGSNDIGLDRGQLGGEKVVKFIRSGPKLLLLESNYQYRAESEVEAERKSVQEAFAQSVLAGFEIAQQSGDNILVDITAFLLSDRHQVTSRLKQTGQGNYDLDLSRSAIYLERTKNFPKNSEFESMLTFAYKGTDPPADWIRSVAPTPESVTIRQHHSFVELPDSGYEKRVMDPRSGFFGISYHDYATPIDQPLIKRFIQRHRLEKADPAAEISDPVEPIIYYLDPGAPEPIRSALLDGASWWNQAFEAIGYRDAFRVMMLPPEADPLDVRYNVIQWVHRSTRGWSYGNTVKDPRTGEIIKGHVSLGSLRVRQDFLIAQGLIEAYKEGATANPELLEMALARLRQLSAHEVGHTLGLTHNFAASVNNRASVMDYPHPLVLMAEDDVDFSAAYDKQIGAWDIRAILYGYQDFPAAVDERTALNEIIQETIEEGYYFITDRDARPQGGSHPLAHLWDNGEDAVAEMERILTLRASALNRFGLSNLAPGTPLASLEEVLVPLYLSHRYQSEAVAKLVGGVDYTYAVKGDGQQPWNRLPSDIQIRAINALIHTLSPSILEIPQGIRELIPPKPPGYQRTRESFDHRTGVTFDPITAAEGAAAASLNLLLDGQRATRLVQQQAYDPDLPGLADLLEILIDNIWKQTYDNGYYRELNQRVAHLALHRIMQLARDQSASPKARAVAAYQLHKLHTWFELKLNSKANEDLMAHYQQAVSTLTRFRENPQDMVDFKPLDMPDGSPIGQTHCAYFDY